LAFRPFEYSDELLLSLSEKEYDLQAFNKKHDHPGESAFNQLSQQSESTRKSKKELHSIYYFPESPSERGINYKGGYVNVDWNDPVFKAQICQIIKPRNELNLVTPPSDRVSVAIHWRAGSGPDTLSVRNYYPCKLPSEEYYFRS
jgi:hypothetical protein